MTSPTPLKFLMPGWFSVVMGLCGLSLAWHRAVPLMVVVPAYRCTPVPPPAGR